MRMLRGEKPGKALDIGCGAGDLCEMLFAMGSDIKVVDFSDDALSLCQQRRARLGFPQRMQLSKESPLELAGRYDAVFICDVLEHIEDDVSIARRIHELRNDKGTLIVSVPAHHRWFGASDRYVGHFGRYDKGGIVNLLTQNGFTIELCLSYGVPLANMTEIVRNLIYRNKTAPDKESGSKQSGTDRSIEYRFRVLLNNVVRWPFYALQELFFGLDARTATLSKRIRADHELHIRTRRSQ